MGKTIMITGSSSGIGRATVVLFQKKGWNVVATMRNPEKETQLNTLPNVACIRLDVLEPDSIRQAIRESINRFGSIDVIVNNAGYAAIGPFEASTDEQIRKQFDTNVFGLMNVTREVIPHLREKKNGIIINVASVGGRVTFPLYSLYHGTKWAVEGFSESLQHELRQFGIKIKIIEPGPIKTDFYTRSADIIKKDGLKAYDSYVNRTIPNMNKSGEAGSPPEYTAGVIYKAATDNSWQLRYAAGGNAGAILLLRKLLPDRMFNGFVRNVVEK